MIDVSTGVVAQGRGVIVHFEEYFPEGLALQRSAFEGIVEIGRIGGVVLVVVQVHGLLVDVGLESIVRIRKRG